MATAEGELLVTTPSGNIGKVNLTVTNPANGGSVNSANAFEYLYRFTEPPIAGSNGPVCAGATVNLVASTIPGATYAWTGPNGFTSTQQNPVIAAASTAASGAYSVVATISGYSFPAATANVTVNALPTLPVISAAATAVAGKQGLTASVPPRAGSIFNWTITNGTITAGDGTNQVTFTAGTAGTANGAATVTVQIAAVAPGLFSANASGQGLAAAVALRVKANGAQSFEPITRFDPVQNRFVAVPLDLGPAGEQVFLILYGTGIRFRGALSAVTAKLGGVDAQVSFAGAQGSLVGLDQVNALIPRSLIGRGEVDVVLTVDGKTANTVRVAIK